MRIGIFTNNYLPLTSGVAISVESFRKELTKLGHQVFIFAPNYKRITAKIGDNKKFDETNVFRFPSIELGKDVFYSLSLPFTPKIDRVIRKINLDIIHSQHPYWIGYTATWYSKKLNIPLAFTYHTLYDEYSHYVPFVPQPFLKWYLRKTSFEYTANADTVIVPTESTKKILEKQGANFPMHIVSTGISLEKFKKGERETVRAKHNFKKDDTVLFCVCRLEQEKNLDFLVESLAPILKNNSATGKNIYLMIVGRGPYQKKLEVLAKKLGVGPKIILKGLVPNNEIADYYKAGDIFVYTSVTETQGIILIEAMASSLPVVAVEASGSRDVIINNKNGFLTKNIQSDFREKTEFLINNFKLREKFANFANTTAEEYSVEKCTEKLVKVYEEAIKNKKLKERFIIQNESPLEIS